MNTSNTNEAAENYLNELLEIENKLTASQLAIYKQYSHELASLIKLLGIYISETDLAIWPLHLQESPVWTYARKGEVDFAVQELKYFYENLNDIPKIWPLEINNKNMLAAIDVLITFPNVWNKNDHSKFALAWDLQKSILDLFDDGHEELLISPNSFPISEYGHFPSLHSDIFNQLHKLVDISRQCAVIKLGQI